MFFLAVATFAHLTPGIVEYFGTFRAESNWMRTEFFGFFFAYNLSPLVSSFPSVRRCCHPSLGPRQWYNGSVWGLATDTITWVADKVLLPRPTKAKQLLIQTGPFPLLQMTMKVDCELYKANTLLMRFSIPSRF